MRRGHRLSRKRLLAACSRSLQCLRQVDGCCLSLHSSVTQLMNYSLVSVVFAGVLSLPAISQAPAWGQIAPSNSPSDRARSAMAYDSVTQRVVLFGGRGSTSFNDTWKYDGVDWAQVTTANSPGVRSLHVMAYDSVRQKMVVFGGAGPAPLHDTWEYDGVDWMQVTPTGNVFPSNRHSNAMVYDSARQMMVMFGGYGSSIFNDTWEYDGVGWTQITTANSPSPRMGHTMVYDSARGKVVLFGGQNSSSSWNNDTWEYDGSNWTQVVTASSPVARPRHAMAYDSTLQKVVMFGGYGVGNIHLNDTWEYDGVTWTQMATASSPGVRYFHEMVYDSARAQMVMFGGADAAPVGGGGPPTGPWEIYLGDTWEYGSGSSVLASAISYGSGCGIPALAFSPTSNPIVGTTAGALITNAPTIFAGIAFGVSDTTFNGLPLLPFNLASIGMPGCFLLQSNEISGLSVTPVTASSLQFDAAIPSNPALLSQQFYIQAYALAPGANAAQIVTSNGISWIIGNQ